jgi:O-methyltransferase
MITNQNLCNLLSRCIETRMLDFERGCSIVYHLLQCQSVEGDIVEFGTYRGSTAALMASLSKKKIWLYDAFSGLPEKQRVDGNDSTFKTGTLATSINVVIKCFQDAGLPQPMIINKWFKDVIVEDLPESIAFAHLDGDFYESIRDSIRLVYPKMTQGGIVIIDDYNHNGLPGVKAAIDEYLNDKPEKIIIPIGIMGPDGVKQGPDGLMLHALFVKM